MGKNLLTVFPYYQTPQEETYPIVPLKLQFGKKAVDSSALIDSGATTSIFRPEVAEQLDLKIETGKEVFMHGVGGRIKGYLHKLKLEIGNKNFTCPIIFSREYLVSLNLLGREGVFSNFKIIFDEKRKVVELQ